MGAVFLAVVGRQHSRAVVPRRATDPLSTLQGAAKKAGASRSIAVDTNPRNFAIADCSNDEIPGGNVRFRNAKNSKNVFAINAPIGSGQDTCDFCARFADSPRERKRSAAFLLSQHLLSALVLPSIRPLLLSVHSCLPASSLTRKSYNVSVGCGS
jgi:hypothetical protein